MCQHLYRNYTVWPLQATGDNKPPSRITFEAKLRYDVNGDDECNILDVKRVKLAYSGYIKEPNADIEPVTKLLFVLGGRR